MYPRFITLGLLSLALMYAVYEQAGVTPDWNWSVAAAGFTGFVYFTANLKSPVARLDRLTVWLLGLFTAIPVIQVIPLPANVIAWLSPVRVELLRAAELQLGPLPGGNTLSVAPWLTLQYVFTVSGLVLVFVVVRELSLQFRDHGHTWAPAWPLLAIATVEGVLGFIQAYAEGGEGFARGTYVNRDHYAGLLELVIPFAVMYPVAILSRNKERHESPALPALKASGILAIAAVLLIGIIHSLSRMGFLATLAALFIIASTTLSLRSYIERPVVITLWRKIVPIGAAALVVIMGFIFLPTDPLIARFSDLAKTEDISADTRAQIWRDSASLVRAFPVVGVGLGAYESALMRYKTVGPMNTTDYAHNDYVQVLAEMGIVGFGIGMLLLLRIIYSAAVGAIYAGLPEDRLLSIACFGSLIAIILHSFVDFNLYVPANSFAIAWIAGISATELRVPVRRQRKVEFEFVHATSTSV
jgi:O-antigen ligase